MFCTRCGKEIQEDWVDCPYCGNPIKVQRMESAEATEENDKNIALQSGEGQLPYSSTFMQRNDGGFIRRKDFVKYILLSLVTMGIYGLYVLYVFSKDINKICAGDGKNSPNYIVVMLLGMCTLGIYPLYWWYKQAGRLQDAAPRYGVTIKEGGGTIVGWQVFGSLLFGLGQFVAVYIMFDNMNRIAMVYNGEKTYEEMQQMGPAHPKLIQNVAIAAAGIFALMLILVCMGMPDTGSADNQAEYIAEEPIEATEEPEEEAPEEPEEITVDFSVMDLADLIGKSENDLPEIGFEESIGDIYGALDGDLLVTCEDGIVNTVSIKGNPQEAPSLYGVRLGMSREDAYKKLLKKYPEDTGADGLELLNPETGEYVSCTVTDDKIATMECSILSVSELDAYQEAKREAIRSEFVFPDSDNKYLTEEEVREKDADQLLIGRNEIFARHGYIFQEPEISAHFTGTSWYQGTVPADQFQSDQVFNDYEKKNVELIKQIEDEISGAAAREAEKQAAIDAAYKLVVGRTILQLNGQPNFKFTASGDFIAEYGGDAPTEYYTYYFSADYLGTSTYLTVFVNIGGVQYTFEDYPDGTICLSGEGQFNGWYEIWR